MMWKTRGLRPGFCFETKQLLKDVENVSFPA